MKPVVNIVQSTLGTSVAISGVLTVKHAKLLMSKLQEVSVPVNHLEVNAPTEIDLAALQILWAFEKRMKGLNASFKTSFKLQEKDRVLLQRTGFETIFHTSLMP